MHHVLPYNIMYDETDHVVTFMRINGANPAEVLLRYLEEEFPFVPTRDLLLLIVPELVDVGANRYTFSFQTEESAMSNQPISRVADKGLWDRVQLFRYKYQSVRPLAPVK